MLTIDCLRLSLPAGYASRADRIARLVAEALSTLPLDADARYDRVSLPPVDVARGASDRWIAGTIARAIAADLNGRAKGGTR